MSFQGISTGSGPNIGDGDTLLDGAAKINSNFSEIYNSLGNGTTINAIIEPDGINTGSIVGTSLTITGNVTLGDVDSDTINANGRFGTGLVPNLDGTHDLGSSTYEWNDLYIDGTASIDTLTVDESATITSNLDVAGNITGSVLISDVAQGTAPLTVTSTTLVSNLNADLLDGQQGAYYLNTLTSFGGDVSGTYNAIVVADDSHNHVTSNIDGFTEAVQDIAGGMWTGNTESGVSVTYQDGDGTLDINVNDPTITLSGAVTGSATMTNLGNVTINTTATSDPTITLSGAVTGSATMTNLGNVTITTTATSDPTITLSGAVTGSATMTNLGNVTITTTATSDPTLTLSGDVTGSATFTNLGNATLNATVANSAKLNNQNGSYYRNASNLNDGTVNVLRLGSSGTRDSSTFLRGDNTWAAIDTSTITDGTTARATATSSGVSINGDLTFNGSGGFTGFLKEKSKRTSQNLTTNNLIYLSEGMVQRFTTVPTGLPPAPNIKYASTDSIKNHMSTGDVINVTLMVPVTAAANQYLFSGTQSLKIDGTDVPTFFVGGARPTASGNGGVDIYNITIYRDNSTGTNASDFFAIVSQSITIP